MEVTWGEVIAVSQDALAQQAKTLHYSQPTGSSVILGRDLHDGGLAMVFMRASPLLSGAVTCDAACWAKTGFPVGTALDARDLWAHGPASEGGGKAVSGQDFSVQLKSGGSSATFKFTVQASV